MATDPGLQESRTTSGSWADPPDRDGRGEAPSRAPDATGRAEETRPMQGRRADAAPAPTERPTSDESPARSKRSLRRSRKVRKVHRVVRHIEVWSVIKLATLFLACGYVIGMVSGYLLWRAADRVGTIDGIEGFLEDAGGYDRFEILGDVVFRTSAVLFALVCGLALFTILMGVVLFNLVSDLTGGIRMTVIDEDLVVAPARRRRPAAPGGPTATRETSPAGPDPEQRNPVRRDRARPEGPPTGPPAR